jgi:hypothetical protein
MIRMPHLKDVLMRPPTQRASEIEQPMPHQWVPAWLTQGDFGRRLLKNDG